MDIKNNKPLGGVSKSKKIKKIALRSPLKKKIILLLLLGCVFGLTLSRYHRKRAVKGVISEWKEINRQELFRAVKDLEKKKLVKFKQVSGDEYVVKLSALGIAYGKKLKIAELHVKKQKEWDGLWRMVIFDIPEKKREVRDSLRLTLLRGGFAKLQHSVLVCPFPCEKEIKEVIKYYEAKKYIHYCEVSYIMNDAYIKKAFKLN